MQLSRRTFIGSSAAGLMLLAPATRAAGFQGAAALRPMVERLRAFAEADLVANGFPGMQVALVGPGGQEATFAVGSADKGVAASPEQLFQIGSISKSLTAMAVFVLASRGRIDLGAPVQDLLPDLPLPPEPITVLHLLEHSSGMPGVLSDPAIFDAPGGRLWTGFTPGSRYSYCNLGYGLLGMIVSRAVDMPFDEALRTLVLRPIGMTGAEPVIVSRHRARYATGFSRFREDVPWLPGARLAPARWSEFTWGSGSVGATAADMVRYMRFVIQLGQGRGAPLFPDAYAQRFRTATIDQDMPGRRYGNGLVHLVLQDRPVLRHTGGMTGFSSAFTVDPAAGVGIYASVNVGGAGAYRPNQINDYAIALLRAAAAGQALPKAREPEPPQAAPEPVAARLVGEWRSADGDSFTIGRGANGLTVSAGGVERRLMPNGTVAVTDHPALSPYFLAPHGDGATPVVRLGSRLFGRGSAPPAPATSARHAALAGTYYNPAANTTLRRVDAVGDQLFAGAQPMRQAEDGSWRISDTASITERLWFERPSQGRPDVYNLSGIRFTRLRIA